MSEKIWTLREIQQWSVSFLEGKKFHNPKTDVELLLMAALSCSKLDLYTQFERPLSKEERERFKALLMRRANNEPVQYITGMAYFMGLPFKVTPDVLIPRFDTEALVETVLKNIPETPCTIIDVGTGSGAIAVSLAHFRPQWDVMALDISPEALVVAHDNASAHKVNDRVRFIESDLLTEIIHEQWPLPVYVVSNPPYIAEAEYLTLHPEVIHHEPKQALVADQEGLVFYRNILGQAAILGDHLRGVFFEIGYKQAAEVQKILVDRYHQPAHTVKDIGGNDRVVYTLF